MEAFTENTTMAGGSSEIQIPKSAPQQDSTPVVDTKAPAPAEEKITVTNKAEPQAAPALPEKPQYQPNYKFKSMQKEHEIDEWARSFIKDQDTEKKFKELYEKAYGLDHYKGKVETTAQERDQYKTAYTNLHQDASEAMEFKNRGDLDGFFEKVGLNPDKVYQWVYEKIQRQNLPPEQQKVYNDLEAKNRETYQYSRQITEMETRYQQIATQAREAELNSVLARADINPIVQSFDAKWGPGAFKQEVAKRGVMHHSVYGEDPAAETIVSELVKYVGDAYKAQPTPVSTPTASGDKPLPVIPNVSGKNVSPTRRAPKSIDDIRKIAAEMSTNA